MRLFVGETGIRDRCCSNKVYSKHGGRAWLAVSDHTGVERSLCVWVSVWVSVFWN